MGPVTCLKHDSLISGLGNGTSRRRLHLTGGYADGKMVMSGLRMVAGNQVVDRISWHNSEDGSVRQVWEQSSDDGETWTNLFDGLYTPRK